MAQRVKIFLQCRRPEFNSWIRKIPWRRKWQPTPLSLPGKSYGQRRSLVGYSPQGCKELDMTERLHFHFLSYSFTCVFSMVAFAMLQKSWVGEGNGNPLQYFAWKIPWMEEPGRLQSMGSLRVGHDWSELAAAAAEEELSSCDRDLCKDQNIYYLVINRKKFSDSWSTWQSWRPRLITGLAVRMKETVMKNIKEFLLQFYWNA